MIGNCRLTFLLWLPLFAAIVTAAAQNGFADFWLFAVAMGLATWSLADAAGLLWQHLQHWHQARRRTASPDGHLTRDTQEPRRGSVI